jgi:PKD repeat protein
MRLIMGKPAAAMPAKSMGNQTSYTLTGLNDGATYYFAAKAYNSGKTTWSGFSNQVSATIPSPPTAPTAGFNANPTSGTAPLTVTFTDTSIGNITTWSWNFGDGTTSTAKNAAKTYTNPGSYTVGLTVTGPAGSNTASRTISVATAAPVANFTATPIFGTSLGRGLHQWLLRHREWLLLELWGWGHEHRTKPGLHLHQRGDLYRKPDSHWAWRDQYQDPKRLHHGLLKQRRWRCK